jgi:hypothetical protein
MSSPEIRFTQYDAATLAEVVDDLAHLATLAGSVIGTPPEWQSVAEQAGSFRLTTVAVAARLAGYVTGHVRDGRITIDAVVIAPSAAGALPGLSAAVVDAFIDAADAPWADVVIPREAAAVAQLIADGWDPVPDQSVRGSRAVVLSGASAS